jgi:hypothetical protein
MKTTNLILALKIVFYYLIFSLLWIISSDLLLSKITADTAIYTTLSIIKGWLFVLVTSALLYWLIMLYSKQKILAEISLRESEEALRGEQGPVQKSGLEQSAVYGFGQLRRGN